jgi:site-specific recombinase XerD
LYRHCPTGSVEQYERTFAGYLNTLPTDRLDAFTSASVHSWATSELERGVGARTVHSRLAHLSALGAYLVRHRLLEVNPLRDVEWPRFKKTPSRFLFPDELRALLSTECADHERVALELFLDTMLRVSELVHADVGDLGCHGRRGTAPRRRQGQRGEAGAPVARGRRRRADVSLCARSSATVGPAPGQLPRSTVDEDRAFAASGAAGAAGRHHAHSAHKLRHTAASLALASGVNPLAVSKLLNHSNLKTTEQYLHLLPNALVDARAQQRAGLTRILAG